MDTPTRPRFKHEGFPVGWLLLWLLLALTIIGPRARATQPARQLQPRAPQPTAHARTQQTLPLEEERS